MNPNPTDPNKPNPTTAPTDSLTPPPPAPTESGPAGEPVSTFTPPADLSSAISNPAIPAAPAADINLTPSPIPNPWENTGINPSVNPLPTNPVQSEPTPIPNLTEPVNQSAISTEPQPWAPPTSQSEPTWPPTPVTTDLTTQPTADSQPMPTFTPPQPTTPLPEMTVQPIPTFTSPTQPEIPPPNSQDFMSNMPTSGQPELNTNPAADAQQLPTPTAADPAPTDLSHLIPTQNGEQAPVYTPPITQPETLVVPPDGNGTVAPNIPTETKAGFPKWVIGAAVALLLIVSAASAYFILGIGQAQNTSAPATQQVQQKPITAPPAIITSAPPAATGSATGAGFGQFQAPPPPPATGSSAADILRQRLGR